MGYAFVQPSQAAPAPMQLRIFVIVFALASLAPVAHAADIARAKRKDGTTIVLTDAMPGACNRLNFHGGARMQRGTSVQPACWTFDWKKRVFTVMPLTARKTSKTLLTGIAQALGVEREAAWVEQHMQGDSANQVSLPANAFTWFGKQAPAAS